MKKLMLAAFALTTAASVFAQGTLNFGSRYGSTVGNQTIHIWGPGTGAASTVSLIGLGSNDAPTPGVTPFNADGRVMIGQLGTAGANGAGGTMVQLLGALGTGAAESSLVPVGLTTTFRTGTAAGGWTTFSESIAGIAEGQNGTFEMVAWDSSTGLTSWTLASTAWENGLIAAGKSGAFNVNALGGSTLASPNLNQLTPLNSFNLYFIGGTTPPVPEPSTFALAGLGAAALLIFRRRK